MSGGASSDPDDVRPSTQLANLIKLLDALTKSAAFAQAFPRLGGLVLMLWFVIPLVAVVGAGSFFADQRPAADLHVISVAAYPMLIFWIAGMVVALWITHIPGRWLPWMGALGYVGTGLMALRLEALTATSWSLGIWPGWQASSTAMLTLLWNLCTTLMGLMLLSCAFSVPFVLAQALDSFAARSRHHKVKRHSEAGTDRVTDQLADKVPDRAGRPALRLQRPRHRLDDLAGMAELKAQLREFIAPHASERQRGGALGPADTNGLLLTGPAGNGKSAFAEALAGEMGLGLLKAGVQELTSKFVNESPERIQQVFALAIEAQPCVLFLDEFDAVGAKRGVALSGGSHGEDIKVVDTLLTEIDGLRRHQVLLIAATNHPDALDEALVRPGRFDRKIEIPLPDAPAREGILSALSAKYGLGATPHTVSSVAQLWERRSAAFIEAVCKRVRDDMARQALRSAEPAQFKAAARALSRREGAIPKTGTPLSQQVLPAATMRDAQSIVYRLRHWETLAERGGSAPKGVLLYGPPGTGKTHMVRSIALELGDWHVFEVKTADILHDPRRFQAAIDTACEHRPAIVFIDEADDLLRDRSVSVHATATNEILKVMDGLMGCVPELVFFAATNQQDAIDAAAKRGGRFGERLFLDLLRGEDLVAFAHAEMARRHNVRFSDELSAEWIGQAAGEVGPADLVAVFDRAINTTLVDDAGRPVGRDAFADAFATVVERRLLE